MYTFRPRLMTIADVDLKKRGLAQEVRELVRAEPMLFGCDESSAYRLGGPLTRVFTSFLGEGPWILDSRVHMLMPGWYPCIPGWHHDDVPRERDDGQPEYDHPSYRSDHMMMIVDSGTGSNTEFLTDEVTLERVPDGSVVYREWDARIRARVGVPSRLVRNCEVLGFSDHDFHRGSPAISDGWRWFIRASRGTRRPFLNETRKQVQVYVPAVMAGW